MYQNIIFDMGGVLLEFSERRILDFFYGDLSPEDRARIWAAIREAGPWQQWDRGEIGADEVLRIACARLPERLHNRVRRQVPSFFEAMAPIPETNALVRELKAMGRNVYLLTNVPSIFEREKHRIPCLDAFDGILASYEVHLLKPEREMYLAFLERFSLRAEDCFFIDDMQANIDGAAAAGISGHCFADGDVGRLREALGV